MTPNQESQARDIIARQLPMSGQTLDALRRAGLRDDTMLKLDFWFNAPSVGAAKSLAAHLADNGCLEMGFEKAAGFFSGKYTVKGKTQDTQVTVQILGEWLPWIVVQGIIHDCEFDGWGAEI
jgi:hypothetical protein